MGYKRKTDSETPAALEKASISQGKAAKALGMSQQAISKNRRIQKNPDGSVDIAKTREVIDDLTTSERRKAQALARRHELELAEREGRLISVEVVEQQWSGVLQAVKNAFLSLPDACAAECAALTDVRQVRDRLKAEVHTILHQLPEQILGRKPTETEAA